MFCHDRYGVSGNSAKSCVHTHKYFPDLLKSNRNQVVFTIFRVIWNQTDRIRLLFQINPKMVNTILFRFDFIRFQKKFSVCGDFICLGVEKFKRWQNLLHVFATSVKKTFRFYRAGLKNLLLVDNNKVKMTRTPEKKQKENPVGCTGAPGMKRK